MTMKQRILDKVEESFVKAEKFYGKSFQRPSTIIFKTTGTNAGHCHFGRKELMFQIAIAEKAGDAFIERTPAHEVAHWIEKEVYGYQYKPSGRRDVHGRYWKYIMTRVMGQDASRCHSFDTSEVKRKRQRFAYTCSNGHTLNLSSVIHNRIRKGTHSYRCKCGCSISLKVPTREERIKELEDKIAKLNNNYA